ncbi:MAG TPA: type II toxin-antitoxin system VapC family toxin [Caulobacteraceae bacterium]|nr:type II toxin-antitoxin system VapC family toxin [Caulobacteraceae bacterium]
MTVYLDTSVVASLFTTDVNTARAAAWLAVTPRDLALSEWTLTEFSSALAIMERALRITASERLNAEAVFDGWLSRQRPAYPLAGGDALVARGFIRAVARPLRAGDALHLALVQRLNVSLGTFDIRMAAAATDLGIPVEAI